MPKSPPENEPGEVFIEYTRVGKSVRVTAIDADTGVEVSFQAPVSLGSDDMQALAIQKLRYVLKKQKASKS